MIREHTATPVIAYRHFRVTGWGTALEAVTDRVRWTAELQEAQCQGEGHRAPEHGCHCGLHAFGDLGTAKRWRPPGAARTVLGAVRMHGTADRPIIGRELPLSFSGMSGSAVQVRAPYGRLVAILDTGRRARKVARAVGVPVLPERDAAGRPQFESFAREHGVEVRPPVSGASVGSAPAGRAAPPAPARQSAVTPTSRPPVTRRGWAPPVWPSPWPLLLPTAVALVGVAWAVWAGERHGVTLALAAYCGAAVVTGWRALGGTRAANPLGLILKAGLAVLVGLVATPFTLFPGPYVWPALSRLLALTVPRLARPAWWLLSAGARLAGRATRWLLRLAGRALAACWAAAVAAGDRLAARWAAR